MTEQEIEHTIEIACLAGFVAGEGYIAVEKSSSKNFALILVVVQCTEEPLQRLQHIFGGSIRPMKRASTRHLQAHRWRVNGKVAAAAIRQMLPYLMNKIPSALNALAYQELVNTQGTRRGKPLTTGERKAREYYNIESMRLNGLD